MTKLKKPFNTTSSKDGKLWKTKPTDGIIGGFTFSNGRKSLIYQCGICLKLLEFNDTWNDHHREHDANWIGVQFGSAEPQNWQELDILESEIVEAKK